MPRAEAGSLSAPPAALRPRAASPAVRATAADRGDIVISGVSVRYGTEDAGAAHVALKDVNLNIAAGEFVCFVGPSGCGKSTLLNVIAGRIRPSAGSIRHNGEAVSGINRAVGYMTQDDNLLPWRTVARNVGLALEIRGLPREERAARVEDILGRVGLAGFGNRYPSQLSGGMRKRAALARTMIYDPGTLLLDEPFGAVDALLRSELQKQLMDLWMRDRKTVVFVTHDLEEALLLADTIHVFGIDPGRVIHSEAVDWPHPRDALALRDNPAFVARWARLRGILAGAMMKGSQP